MVHRVMSKVIFRSQAKLDDPERWWYFESKWTVQKNRRVKVNGPRILKGKLRRFRSVQVNDKK